MGMNAPGGGGNAASDKVIIQTALQSDKAQSEQAGAQSAKSWLDGFRKAFGTAPMPGGAQAPGRGASSSSIYGQQAGQPGAAPDYRNSGTRGAPPRGPGVGGAAPPTPGAPAAAGEEDDGRVYSRTPQDIRRFRVRRTTASEEERQQALADKEDEDNRKAAQRENAQGIRERQRQARADDRSAGARGRYEDELNRDVLRGARGGLDPDERAALLIQERMRRERTVQERADVREARGAGAAARTEQRRVDRQRGDQQRAEQEIRRAYGGGRGPAGTPLDVMTPQARDDYMAAQIAQRTQQERDQRVRDIQSRDQYNRQFAARIDTAGANAVRRRAIEQQGGIGGFFAQRNLAATDAMQGGLGPVPRAASYGLSAMGNMLLLGMPLINAYQGGAFGDINIPLPFGLGNIQGPQGDIQTTRRLNAQQNAERLRMANISYGRSMYSAQVETQALGIARTREGIQYGYQQADITRTGTRETADYARDTVKLQREALVHQRDYARSTDDLERKRLITQRDYARQVEDTGRQQFIANRNYSRQIEDTGRQRALEDRNYRRQYEDFARTRIVEDRNYQRQYQDFARQRRDDEIQFSRQRQDLNRQAIADTVAFARGQQDIALDRRNLGISYGRQQQDTAIASGRSNEDYQRERGRAQVAMQDTLKLREIQGRTNLRDLRMREQDIGASQFQSIGGLIGAAQSGDPFAIIGSLYRMRQLRQEKAIVQGDIGRGGFTEAEKYQQGVQDKQAGYGLQDIDREHARQQQDIALQQKRNNEDYQRGLQDINKQEQRMNEDRQRQLEATDIQSKRIDQDAALRKQDLDVQQKRADEDHATNIQNTDIQQKRADEDHATNIQNIDIQQSRFFEDYQTNLQQIAIQQTRQQQDYAENVRTIALQQMRAAQDRITQIQQEGVAQSALDVARARSVEDLTIQQQRVDVAHAQSLEDFEIREKAILVSQQQSYEDLQNARIAVDREAEAQTIALDKEMRSLYMQLALSVGLFGIFSGQFFQAAKYLLAFAGIIGGSGAGAAALAAARGGGGFGDVSVGASTAGQAGQAGSGPSAPGLIVAGLSLAPAVVAAIDKMIREYDPGFTGFGFGTPVAQAAEMQTTPGGINTDTGAGAIQGDFSYSRPSSATASVEARDNWQTERRRAGNPGGYSPMANGQGTVEQNPALAGGDLGGASGEIKSNFSESAALVDKIKKNYEGMDGTAEDIQKQFEAAYGRAGDVKNNVGDASGYSVTIQNSLANAAQSSMQVSANMAAAAGASGGVAGTSGDAGTTSPAGTGTASPGTTKPKSDPYGADFQATRDYMQSIYGDPSGGLAPPNKAADDAMDKAFRNRPNYVEPQVIYPNKTGQSNAPSAAGAAANASTSSRLNLRPVPFGFRSNFSPSEAVMGGGGGASNSVDALRNSIDRLTNTIQQGATGGTSVSHSALNNKVAGVMNQWLRSGMIG